MYENHQKLKEARTSARKFEQDHKNLGDRLEQERQKNSRIEQDVKNFEERERNLAKIKNLQMKRAWVVCNNSCKHSHNLHFWEKRNNKKVLLVLALFRFPQDQFCLLSAGVILELSNREKFYDNFRIKGEVLVQILDFPIHSIHFHFSLSSR